MCAVQPALQFIVPSNRVDWASAVFQRVSQQRLLDLGQIADVVTELGWADLLPSGVGSGASRLQLDTLTDLQLVALACAMQCVAETRGEVQRASTPQAINMTGIMEVIE